MIVLPHIADASEAALATDLIETFGSAAAAAARSQADRSRDLGNHLHFCRWRQIARLIALLDDPRGAATLH
jgi:hypothetical protein